MIKKWWHGKIGYQVYPKSFYDTNGDGVGDLRGVIEKLDYIRELGADILWLSPVYPSPMVDNGYDISDYQNIDPRFGTMADMEELIAKAKERDMGVLMDLVVNHTSDKHPWFQKALADPQGEYGAYYYFKDGKDGAPPTNWRSYFGGSAWERVPGYENKYYLHLFAKGQPDLNWENPRLREKLYEMMHWWLDKGIAGFRIDAIINIKKDLSWNSYPADGPDGLASPHLMLGAAKGVGQFLGEMRDKVFIPRDAFTVGEVFDMPQQELAHFIGENGYFSTMFAFGHTILGMEEGVGHLYRRPAFRAWRDALLAEPLRIQGAGCFANVLENHDRPRAASTFLPAGAVGYAGDTMLATASVLLPGIPFLYQGQEIGMTNCPMGTIEAHDDIDTIDQYRAARAAGLGEAEALRAVEALSRDNARTPMQWDDGPNAGFTAGKPWLMVNPNYKEINVRAQRGREDTVLGYYKHLLALRKAPQHAETFTYGELVPLYEEQENLIAYLRRGEERLLVLCNGCVQAQVEAPGPHSVLLQNFGDLKVQGDSLVLKPYQAAVLQLLD